MKLIPVDKIHVAPDRQRRVFDVDSMQALTEDIEENGLFNAVVLRTKVCLTCNGSGRDGEASGTVPCPTCGGTATHCHLVQGERRLRAMRMIWDLQGTFTYDSILVPQGQVPFVSLSELDPLRAEIAELSENLCREDLTWQERAAATAKIAAIRAKLAAQAGDPPPSRAAIAEETRGSDSPFAAQATNQEIILSGLLDDPDIAKAPTLREAWKIAKRQEAQRQNEARAAALGGSVKSEQHTLLNTDSLGWITAQPPEQFDVILADPPYGMGADSFGNSDGRAGPGSTGEHAYQDDDEAFMAASTIMSYFIRIAKPEAHLYVFCDIDRFAELRRVFDLDGWWVHRTPLVWHNTLGSRVPWPEHGPQRKYELILYAVKGKKPTQHIRPDVISLPPDVNLGRAAQKPVALYQDLLSRSVRPGDTVLDCFAGTGPLLPAAHALKCLATCVERDPAAYAIAAKRLEELK